MKKLYTTSVHVSGGREGLVKSKDGQLELALAMPKELGGKGGATNPEQLFAAGYAACFESALRHVARVKKIALKEASVDGTVELYGKDDGRFQLAARLEVSLPGLDRAQGEALVADAHRVCPYSNATRGNIQVDVVLA